MASLDELLKEYDEIRSTARFAERIPKAERQELMGNMAETMELGQWPGDERVIKDVEKAKTRAGLAHIKSSRAETLGQVERARNMQTSLADADRQADPPVTDRMKGMVSDILSSVFPDQSPKGSVMDVPSVPNVPKMPAPVASTRPAITPDAIVSAPMPPTAPSVAKKPAVIPEGTFIPQDFPKPNAHNRTELNPDDEEYFQEWYADWAKQLDLNPDPDHPDHHYDYRGAWHAAIDPQPEVNPDTGEEEWHWDSRFKDADHPRAILDTPQGRLDTRTGKILPPLPKAEPSGDADFEAKNRSFQAFMANQALGGRTPESLGGKNPLDRYPQDDPSKHGFIGQFIEGAKGGAQQLGEAAAGTMQRLQSPDDTTTILGKKVNVGEMLGKIAGGFSEAAKEHAPHPYMQTLPWYRRLSNPEYLGNVLGNAAVATIPSLSSAIVGGVAGGVPGAAAGMMLTTYLQQAGSSYREALEAYQKQGLSLQEAHAKAYAVSGVAGLTSGAVNTLSIPASLIEPFKRTLSNLILQYGLNVSIDTADQITQNAIKQQTYKPDQELLEAVPETIAASGIFGAPETMVAAKTIATGPAKVTTPSTDKPADEPLAITPELLGGPPPSTPSVAPSTTPTTPVTTEPILSEDEEINLPEIVVRPTDSPEETKSALESAIAQAQEIHDSSAEPVAPQAEMQTEQASTPEAIDTTSNFVYVEPTDVQPTAIETPASEQATAPAPIQSDADKRTLVIQSLQTGKREELQVPSVLRLTPDVLTPDAPATAPSLPTPVEPAAPKALADMSFEDFLNESRFYRSGKTKNLELPNGESVILSQDATASTWKEKSRVFLESVYKITTAVAKAKAFTKARNEAFDSPVDMTPAPPSEPVVNAVNPVVNPETPAPSPALTPDEITTTPAPAEIEPEAPPNVQGSRVLSDWILQRLHTGSPIVKEFIATKANEGFGGTKAQGAYTPKDAFDAVELGVNRFILQRAPRQWPLTVESVDDAKNAVLAIRSKIMDRLPTMGHYRTEEQDEFQQFSTPPDLSYVMNWAANLSPDDTVLEPSAGLGGLAAYAKGAGAEVITNEFSPRRAELLKELELGRGFTENAEQLHNILPPDVKPTVVVMNPPFSSTAGRITGQRKSSNVLLHLDQALKRLQDGGRLVALIGKPKEGMRGKQTAVEKWIADIPKRYALRARIGLSGKGFKKYGTSFDNQILVVDKIPSTGQPPPIIGEVQDVIDAIGLLKPVRSARLRPQARPAQPSGLPAVEAHGGAPDSGLPTALPARLVGARPRRGDAQSTPEAIVSGVGRHPVELRQPGHSAELSPDQPGRPGAADADTRADSGRTGPAIGEPVNPPSDTPALDRGPDPALLGDNPGVSEQDATAPDQPASPSEAMTDAVYDTYRPPKLKIAGAKPHPGNLVESAAMASTPPPTPTYQPHLPKALVEKGGLSLAQLEAVVYAGQAHAQMLPDGTRRGFYVGDGTGVGKGREISGIILDNFNQGRKKAIWISEKNNLMKSAVRDWSDLGQSEGDIFAQSKAKLDGTLSQPKGILFSTYTTLASGMESTKYGGLKGKEDKKTGKTKSSRLEQIIQWVGPDFDGVLVFDEAHNMANSTPQKTKRGDSTPAASALAAVELQKRLPKARVVYFSATAASRIEALSYADRLGLWGPGTAFPDKNAFIAKIQEGGLAAMEIVARDSKAMGVYLSRSLDYRDVTYGRIEHALTPEQREIYDTVAHAWQIIFQNINLAMEATGAKKNAHARAAARGRFWGSHQRFFNQILTALQMPSVIDDMRAQIDRGNAIVVQLVNTNQATQDRQLERREQDEEDYEELDLTPRENLMEFVQQSFPTQQYEEYVDDNGKKATRPVRDSEGNPVHNSDAIAMRDELLTQLGAIKVPDGPLEFILNSFGPEAVAEITGRTQRLVRVKDELGRDKVVKQKRSRAITSAEAKQFQDDQRKILVFSDAGGTGESYHADKRAKNQRKRIHYLVQPGWRADKAVQGLGRTHRTNEASAPHYVLVTTNLKGHRRFISTIARRLDQLGALTKGQRQTGSSGLIDAKDNLENEYASGAVRKLIEDSVRGQESTVPFPLLKEKMGLDRLIDENGTLNVSAVPDVPQFLNRILALEIDEQNAVFDAFYARMERAVEYAASKGLLDVGMETYRADAVTVASDQVVYTEPGSGAQTHLIKMDAKHAVSFIPAVTMEQHARFEGFYRNKKSGKMWALIKGGTKTRDNGAVVNEFKAFGIVDGQYHYIEEQDVREKMTPVSKKIGAEEWEQAIAAHPPFRDESLYLLTGTMLPIWDRLPTQNVRVLRVQTTDGVRHLGRELRAADVPAVLKRLGASQNAEVSQDPQTIMTAILDKKQTAVLANQWKLQRRKVADEWRVEVTGSSVGSALKELRDAGLVVERIGFETRFFVPTGDRGTAVLANVLRHRPVAEMLASKENAGRLAMDVPTLQEGPTPAPTFFSQAIKTIEQKMPARATVQQVRGILSPENGVKPDELKWMGLEDFLSDKETVEKTDLLEYMQENQIMIDEVEKSGRGTKFNQYALSGGKNYRELLLTLTPTFSMDSLFQSPHWNDVNVLAHVRFNDRTGPNGERVLHLEEIQSDWHQAARRGKDVPDAPFRKTWHEFALKRMLRYAAERGYDVMTWTTGAQQADRYDLRKYINSIEYKKVGDHAWDVYVWGRDRRGGILKQDAADESWIEENLGKDITKKITNGEGKVDDGYTYLKDLDLMVGGEGMAGFYDRIIPDFLKKYGKRWGSSVGTATIDVKGTPTAVHAMTITEPMRRSVMEGQALFQRLTPSQRILNNTPYEKRDHTDPAKSDALATAAVGDLDHAADSVRSAGGVFRIGSGATVLGLGFTPSLIRTGRVDLRGRIVRSARDLARLAQVWRDPRFETFRIVYTKDNAIVGQEAVTSRLPGATSLWIEREAKTRELERRLGDFAEVTNSGFARLTYGMARRMQRIGANGYFLLHNHPSGRPLPSGEDFHITERIITKVKGFRGHVVIDSGEYGVIDKNLNDRIVSFPATKQGDRLMRPALAHPAIGANVVNVDDLAQIAKSLQNTDRSVSVIYAGASASGKGFTVRAIEDVPLNLMLREDEFRGYLRGRASAYGAVGIFTAYRQIRPAVAKELGQVAVRLVRSGDLMDHIQYDTPVRMWDKTEGIEARQDRLARTDGSRVEMPVPAYESVDPNVEERIKAAQSGVGKTGLRAKLREVLDATWRKSTREFEHLPDTAEFSRLRTSLLQLQKQRAISVDRQLRHMHDLVGDLIDEDYNLFERAVILRDLKREADAEHLLPFGYTTETLQRDLERVNAEVSNNMLVEQRLEQRTAHVKDLSQRYVKAMGAIGFDVTHKITKEDYFHHQVLEYAREQAASSAVPGTGRKIKTPTGSGFLKRREGSTLDINANYVQAELEVLGKMDYDIHLAEVIATVDEEHNIQPRLKEEARQYNEQAIRQVLAQEGMKGPLNDEWNKIRQKIAMHMSRLKSALNIPASQTLSLDSIQKIAQDSQQVGHDSALGVFKWISRRREFIKTVLGDNFKTWEDLVPDGYTEWQPREGQVFYMADTIPHRLAQQLQERMLAELNVPAEQVKKILALGGKREQYVVPQEVYDTLSTFTPPPSGVIEALSAQVLGTWKAGKLVGPHSVIKYNLRNLTGDLDATFAGNPRALRRAWQAMKELWPVFTKQGTLEGNAKDWYERGGMGTLLQVQEMGDVHDLKIFKALVERRDKGGVMGAVSSVFNKYWETARLSTDFREAILRYANYLEYLNQIKETGKPANYGASIVETVDALKTAQDKAFKLSNELVGAYDRITVTGQHLRKHWIPFWSWKEVNFTRYKQLLKNAMKTNNMPGVARATASRAALSATSFAFRATLLWSMALLWNALFFPDEERDLSERTRNRIHLIIPPGRDEHGKILYLDGIGALGDLLSWIGLDTAASHLAAGDLLHDRVTLGELVTKMGKQPLNILVQGLNPMLKLPAELAAGKQAFPDVFHPRAIQDPMEYTVQQLTPFGTEYKAATGKPGVPYVGKEALEDLFVSRQDPGWAAYSTWQDIEDKWKARLGKSTFEGARRSPKGQALNQWAQAVRLHDAAAVTKYKQRYIDLGGDLKSMKASIKAMAPLHGLNKDERAYIVGQLDSTERAALTKAEAFYQNEIMAILPPMARAEVLGSLLEHGGLSATVIPRQTIPTRKPMAPGMAIP